MGWTTCKTRVARQLFKLWRISCGSWWNSTMKIQNCIVQRNSKKFWLLCGTGHTHRVKGLHLDTCRTAIIHHLHSQEKTNIYPKGWGWKGKQKIYLFGCCYEVDRCVIAIILLRKAEGELIVNEQSICKESTEEVTPCLGIKQTCATWGTMLLRAQRALTNYSNPRMIPHKRSGLPPF